MTAEANRTQNTGLNIELRMVDWERHLKRRDEKGTEQKGTEKKGNESVIKGNEVNQREWKKGKEVNEIEAFCCFFYFCNFETVHNILFHVSGSPSAMYFSLSYRTKMFATSYNKWNKKAKKKNQQNRQKGRDGKGNRGF